MGFVGRSSPDGWLFVGLTMVCQIVLEKRSMLWLNGKHLSKTPYSSVGNYAIMVIQIRAYLIERKRAERE